MTFLEAYALYPNDTIAISKAMGVHESVAAKELARMKGETQPHPNAVVKSPNDDAAARRRANYIRRRDELRESRARRPA